MGRIIRFFVRRYLRIDSRVTREFHPYYDYVDVKDKAEFDLLYEEGLKKTNTPPSVWRRDRFLNLYFFIDYVKKIKGAYVECGAWKGLSSFVICSSIKKAQPTFTGKNYRIIDSFEGLSNPTIDDGDLTVKTENKFSCDIDTVKNNLSDFPLINYHKGWIPETLSSLPEEKYKFVHIDLDLAEPTVGALDYFRPRMQPGGIIVCDDYGGIKWHGMRAVMDRYCEKNNMRILKLSTGQLVILF